MGVDSAVTVRRPTLLIAGVLATLLSAFSLFISVVNIVHGYPPDGVPAFWAGALGAVILFTAIPWYFLRRVFLITVTHALSAIAFFAATVMLVVAEGTLGDPFWVFFWAFGVGACLIGLPFFGTTLSRLARRSRQSPPVMPPWSRIVFRIDVAWLLLVSTTFLWMLTGQWEKSLRASGSNPMIWATGVVNGMLIFMMVPIGIIGDMLVLKYRREGVILAAVSVLLAVSSMVVSGIGSFTSAHTEAREWYLLTTAPRIVFGAIYLLALTKANASCADQ